MDEMNSTISRREVLTGAAALAAATACATPLDASEIIWESSLRPGDLKFAMISGPTVSLVTSDGREIGKQPLLLLRRTDERGQWQSALSEELVWECETPMTIVAMRVCFPELKPLDMPLELTVFSGSPGGKLVLSPGSLRLA